MKRVLALLSVAVIAGGTLAADVVRPGDDLQAVLDRGDDLVLQSGSIYSITKTLKYMKPGQKIYTKGARYPAQFATLRIADAGLTQLINADNADGYNEDGLAHCDDGADLASLGCAAIVDVEEDQGGDDCDGFYDVPFESIGGVGSDGCVEHRVEPVEETHLRKEADSV